MTLLGGERKGALDYVGGAPPLLAGCMLKISFLGSAPTIPQSVIHKVVWILPSKIQSKNREIQNQKSYNMASLNT